MFISSKKSKSSKESELFGLFILEKHAFLQIAAREVRFLSL